MARIGFHASHEQHAPSELLKYMLEAEQLGFQAGMCSDHFHPWSERQGHSGFAWSWLGSALQATNLTLGTVCCPLERYHPAVIAQAAATLAEMYPGRFWLAIGSGEALNEHITGRPWRDKEQRTEMLAEAAQIMRALWAGETVTHQGQLVVDRAKLYTRPSEPPRLYAAAITAATAERVASWADGLITVAKDPKAQRELIEAFRRGGGEGKPLLVQAAISYAKNEEDAVRAAHDQWRIATIAGENLHNIEMPAGYDAATTDAKPEEVKEKLRVSSDIQQHIDWLRSDIELGFDEIYLHHVGRDLHTFLHTFANEVLPEVLPSSSAAS